VFRLSATRQAQLDGEPNVDTVAQVANVISSASCARSSPSVASPVMRVRPDTGDGRMLRREWDSGNALVGGGVVSNRLRNRRIRFGAASP